MALKIISYNVNGIRAAIKKGFIDWMKTNDFDILCLQETKAHREQVPVELIEELGYHHHWHSAEKKGYSSVATFSKQAPTQVIKGCGIADYDQEGRILRTDFGDWTLLNCYFPSGTSGGPRQDFKYAFLDDFYQWIEQLKKERPQLIIVGDYNIAHTENDIHNPKSNKNSSGFLPEERAWMTKWFASGFTDAFRHIHPEKTEYSWWSYRANARANNKGWRIDYQSVSDNLQKQILQAGQLNEAVHSDHCPVLVEMDLKF
ncbi:MAG: exodeoxyribonuclease III [Bacteroidota bacterium]